MVYGTQWTYKCIYWGLSTNKHFTSPDKDQEGRVKTTRSSPDPCPDVTQGGPHRAQRWTGALAALADRRKKLGRVHDTGVLG